MHFKKVKPACKDIERYSSLPNVSGKGLPNLLENKDHLVEKLVSHQNLQQHLSAYQFYTKHASNDT